MFLIKAPTLYFHLIPNKYVQNNLKFILTSPVIYYDSRINIRLYKKNVDNYYNFFLPNFISVYYY